jgi:hypothetical protein
VNKNGFELHTLKQVFTRYGNSTTLHSLENKGLRGIQNSTDDSSEPQFVEAEMPEKPQNLNGCRVVEVQNPQTSDYEGVRSEGIAHPVYGYDGFSPFRLEGPAIRPGSTK